MKNNEEIMKNDMISGIDDDACRKLLGRIRSIERKVYSLELDVAKLIENNQLPDQTTIFDFIDGRSGGGDIR